MPAIGHFRQSQVSWLVRKFHENVSQSCNCEKSPDLIKNLETFQLFFHSQTHCWILHTVIHHQIISHLVCSAKCLQQSVIQSTEDKKNNPEFSIFFFEKFFELFFFDQLFFSSNLKMVEVIFKKKKKKVFFPEVFFIFFFVFLFFSFFFRTFFFSSERIHEKVRGSRVNMMKLTDVWKKKEQKN